MVLQPDDNPRFIIAGLASKLSWLQINLLFRDCFAKKSLLLIGV
jgi:hypothetical protein